MAGCVISLCRDEVCNRVSGQEQIEGASTVGVDMILLEELSLAVCMAVVTRSLGFRV